MSRVDAHQHYWQVSRGDYGWMSAPAVAPIRRDFLPADLEPHLVHHRIESTIVVQAAPTTAETDFLLELARSHESIAGVVGWLDLEAPDFPDQLARYSQHGKFLGIRPMLLDLDDDRFILRDPVIDNLRRLAESGRTLDLLVFSRHLPFALRALETVPELRAVIDHCAKPDLVTGKLDAWRESMSRVGAHPNVTCKLSGLVTEARPGAGAADLAPAVEHVYSVFGPERLMFGSDWPVCTLASDYSRVVALLSEVLGSRLSGPTEQMIFGENARRFYGI
jgi:L-fuconolactonase